MGILDQINERNTLAQATGDQQLAEAAQENEGPDAVQQAKSGRAQHREAFLSMADPDEAAIVDEPAGPEEQKLHERLEMQVLEIVNNQEEGATPALLKAINTAEDPVQGIGMMASNIVQHLKEINPGASQEILFSIGEFLISQLQELVEMADPRVRLSDDDLGEALSIGLQNFNNMNRNEIDDDEMRGFIANV